MSQLFDLKTVRAMQKEGDDIALLEYLQKFAGTHNVEAMIELSRTYKRLGDEKNSNEWMTSAEAAVGSTDFDGMVDLWQAFRTGLGAGSVADKDKKALIYLTSLAEHGNVFAQEILMIEYFDGINGVERDLNRFLRWAAVASAAGSSLAREELQRYQRSGVASPPRRTRSSQSKFLTP